MCRDYTNWGPGGSDFDPNKLRKWQNRNRGEPKNPTNADDECCDMGVLITCIECTGSATEKEVFDARKQVIQMPWGKKVGSPMGEGVVSSLRVSPLKLVITLQRHLWNIPDVAWLPPGASSDEVPSLTGILDPASGGVHDLLTDLRPGVLVLAGQGTLNDCEDAYNGRSSLRMQLPAALDYGEVGDDRTPQVTLHDGSPPTIPLPAKEDQKNKYCCEAPFLTSGVIVSVQCWDNRQGIFMCTQEIPIGEVVRYHTISEGKVESGTGLLIGVDCQSATAWGRNSDHLYVWIHIFKSHASSSRLLPSRDYLRLRLGKWAQGKNDTVCFIMRDGAASEKFWDDLKGNNKLVEFLKPVFWSEFEVQEEEKKRYAIFAQYWDVDAIKLPERIMARIARAAEAKGSKVKDSEAKKVRISVSETKAKRQKVKESKAPVSDSDKKNKWLADMLQCLRGSDSTATDHWREFLSFGRTYMDANQSKLAKYWKILRLSEEQQILSSNSAGSSRF
eukprot:g19987.t1